MPKKIELEVIQAKTLELKPGHKYLMIMPVDASLRELQEAMAKWAPEVKIFVLAANDVSDIRIAEILKEDEEKNGTISN